MYRVSDLVANLITTEDTGVHRGNATEENGSAGVHRNWDYPEMYRVSDAVANLITTGDTGVHRGNATEKNGTTFA